jgi:hypothetical protein
MGNNHTTGSNAGKNYSSNPNVYSKFCEKIPGDVTITNTPAVAAPVTLTDSGIIYIYIRRFVNYEHSFPGCY